MNDYEQCIAKTQELTPLAQWNARRAVTDAFSQGHQFRIPEAYRTQETQNGYILHGRFTEEDFWVDVRSGRMDKATAVAGIALLKQYGGKPGPKNTWTLHSEHTARLAIDVYPLNCTHDQIAPIFARYGIAHKWPTDDPPHYSFDDPFSLLSARLRISLRALPRLLGTQRGSQLQREVDRITKQLNG